MARKARGVARNAILVARGEKERERHWARKMLLQIKPISSERVLKSGIK